MVFRRFVAGLFLFPTVVSPAAELPRSVAVRSQYTRTATEAEVAEFLAAVNNVKPQYQEWTMGTSNEGRPIQALKIGFAENEPQRPLTIAIIGGIHSGECAGKEGLLEIIRELALGEHANWLESTRFLLIPSLSPDSNTRRAVDNRPGQVGPSEGMGTRENAQGLDLNRDFVKLETPEIRALVKACSNYDVDVLIDLHTTNGSQHRYELTYDPPHHPATPTAIRDFLRGRLFPTVTEQVAEQGLSMFYYGNFDRSHSRWSTFGYEGRYGTNYMGLRGKLGILSEAYSYADYQTRVHASEVFVERVLDYLTAHASEVAQLVSQPLPDAIPMTATLQPFEEPYLVKGYKPDPAAAGETREPFDYQVQFWGKFVGDQSIAFPRGYFIPAEFPAVAELLQRHGIPVEKVTSQTDWQSEVFTITDQQSAAREFQKHRLVTLRGEWTQQPISGETDGYWVEGNNPLAILTAVILQPESADSVATWNIIPAEQLAPGMRYPILRIR